MARLCEDSSTKPSTVAFLALLAEREEYKNRCETLTLENQCIPGLSAEARELREKLTEYEKSDAASKTTRRRLKNRATTADKPVVLLEAELADGRAAHTRLIDVSAQAEEDANKVCTELGDLQVRFSEIAGEGELADKSLKEA